MIDDLLALARRLASASPGKPKQADLRRAVSTAYYALFHAFARNAADAFVGTSPTRRPNRAWAHAYRALDHGLAKSACRAVGNMSFPADLTDCADAFGHLQELRHEADYNPLYRVTKADTLAAVSLAESAVKKLRGAAATDRRAFAVQLLLKKR